jgi:hypothetical protein
MKMMLIPLLASVFAICGCIAGSNNANTSTSHDTGALLAYRMQGRQSSESACGFSSFDVLWEGRLEGNGTGTGSTEFRQLRSYENVMPDANCGYTVEFPTAILNPGTWSFAVTTAWQQIECKQTIDSGQTAYVLFDGDTANCNYAI